MTLSIFQRTIVNASGDVQPSASVSVRDELTNNLVQIFSDRAGTVVKPNPFTADENGFATFFVSPGEYKVTANTSSGSVTWNYVAVDGTLRTDLAATGAGKGAEMVAFNASLNYKAGTAGHAAKAPGVSVSDYPWLAKVDGTTDDTAAINAALQWSATSGVPIIQPAGTMIVGGEIVFPDGAVWVAANQKASIVKKSAAHTGRMLITENFDSQKGVTNPDTAGLCKRVHIEEITFDGNWMTGDRSSYVNDAGSGGLFVYAAQDCILRRVRVQNMAGVGVFLDAPVGNDSGNPIGYPDDAKIDLMIDTTKEEGFIFRGKADRVGMVAFVTNAGAKLTSETDETSPPRSSPTYGATNGGLTDGVVILRGTENAFIHSWGHASGQGIVIQDGRHNGGFFMAETCAYGGIEIKGGYGEGNTFEAHRSGGRNGDTRPLVYFNAPTDDSVNYSAGVLSAYHKDTFRTTARNCVEFGPAARGFAGWVKTRGDNVPGHGVVIDGAANDLNLTLDIRGHVGTAADGLPASGLYRKATFSTRSYTIRGRVANCAVGFRSSGNPRHERVELDMLLSAGQTPFTGDARSGVGQVWDITADIDGTLKSSKTKGASAAFSSNTTSEQTVTITHNLIAEPAFGSAQINGVLDSPTSMTAAALQYAIVTSTDDTTITAKIKFSTLNGTDTQPRLLWSAEI